LPPTRIPVASAPPRRYHPGRPAMTRKSIETVAKLFIWAIFLFFIYSTFKVMGMMGIFN
jgi:hypothetical protein